MTGLVGKTQSLPLRNSCGLVSIVAKEDHIEPYVQAYSGKPRAQLDSKAREAVPPQMQASESSCQLKHPEFFWRGLVLDP